MDRMPFSARTLAEILNIGSLLAYEQGVAIPLGVVSGLSAGASALEVGDIVGTVSSFLSGDSDDFLSILAIPKAARRLDDIACLIPVLPDLITSTEMTKLMR
jgi:hypothetical protein